MITRRETTSPITRKGSNPRCGKCQPVSLTLMNTCGLPETSRTTSCISIRTFSRGSGNRTSSLASMVSPSIRELHAVDLDLAGQLFGELEIDADDVGKVDGVDTQALDAVDRERDPHGAHRRLRKVIVSTHVGVRNVGELADADRARFACAITEREAQVLGLTRWIRGAVDPLADPEADGGEGVDVALADRNVGSERIGEIVPPQQEPARMVRRMRVHDSEVVVLRIRGESGLRHAAAERVRLPARAGVWPVEIVNGAHG